MWIQVEHELIFEYSDFISESRMEIRVEPRSGSSQTLRSFALAIGPATRVLSYTDWNGNVVHHFGIGGYHDRIEVLAQSLVETHPREIDLSSVGACPVARSELGQMLQWTAFDDLVVDSVCLIEFASGLRTRADAAIGEQIVDTGELVRNRVAYVTGATDHRSTTDDVIQGGEGVCQDYAHLQIALLRRRNIPARYVSGYLHLGTSEDAESHAWVEVHAGDLGWVGYDPTHECVPDERYVCVGWGRDYDDVAPNRGVYSGKVEERFKAVVRTWESRPHAVVELHQPVAQIDVPVFRDTPSPSEERGGPETAIAEGQQGQQ